MRTLGGRHHSRLAGMLTYCYHTNKQVLAAQFIRFVLVDAHNTGCTQANNNANFSGSSSLCWHVFDKGALSFGAASGQKQTYWSISVYNFMIFLFCYSKKKSP